MGQTLNAEQKQAIEAIDGPMLVLAGPGTGKTHLLSYRVAEVLQKTDASAHNILCLTFTESAAYNMRERLRSIIHDDAYDVQIATYHGFGSDIIRRYPEYFENVDLETGQDSRLERPIDELQALQIIVAILGELPFSDHLRSARFYPKEILQLISKCKQAVLDPDAVAAVAKQNLDTVHALSRSTRTIFGPSPKMTRKHSEASKLFDQLLNELKTHDGELAKLGAASLETALDEADAASSTKPLTAWKNEWLEKDAEDYFTFTSEKQQLKLLSFSEVYRRYNAQLQKQHVYDYDDMILRVIDALKIHPDLKFTLQEQYQYILLDEFQDTNAAQFEVVMQLSDNPVHEGRPNVLAVGDDDQAIYAFQGADVSNMMHFVEAFRQVDIINLHRNYRSQKDILLTASAVAEQIDTRLHKQLDHVTKTLSAEAKHADDAPALARREFRSAAAELSWVATQIKQLIDQGVDASEIAILAPKHRYLEAILPYLFDAKIPVSYEKRENILDSELYLQLEQAMKLLLAINTDDLRTVNHLMPKILSAAHYNLPPQTIWKTNWTAHREKLSWVEVAIDNDTLAPHVVALLSIGSCADTQSLESILDQLIGTTPVQLDENTDYTAPFKDYYFSQPKDMRQEYFQLLTTLTVIREHIRAWQVSSDHLLTIKDLLVFAQAYRTAEVPLINTFPLRDNDKAVQLLTAYKAKGLEYDHVFIINLQNDVWGTSARGAGDKLTLPANLQHIRYQGSSEDELKRILFVAITRAKRGLHMTSHTTTATGKQTTPVKFMRESTDEQGARRAEVLPKQLQAVERVSLDQQTIEHAAATPWHTKHSTLNPELTTLLHERLERYVMNPTHINTFTDLEYGGPEQFLLQTLLRFPQAPLPDGEFGTAIHETLDWYQKQAAKDQIPSLTKTLDMFDQKLCARHIDQSDMSYYLDRGKHALSGYLDNTTCFKSSGISEVDFTKEGVVMDGYQVSGKIDRIEVNKDAKTLRIVDFKTGKPAHRWSNSTKLIKYRQQLNFYILLIQGSHSYKDYTVESARLEYVEPDDDGVFAPPLEIVPDRAEIERLMQLIVAVSNIIQTLELPDVSAYDPSYKGTLRFIADLLGEK